MQKKKINLKDERQAKETINSIQNGNFFIPNNNQPAPQPQQVPIFAEQMISTNMEPKFVDVTLPALNPCKRLCDNARLKALGRCDVCTWMVSGK